MKLARVGPLPTLLDAVLREEAWRNERIVNRFRMLSWGLIGASVIAAGLWTGKRYGPGFWFLGLGVLAGLLDLLWLRKRYAEWIPWAVITFDVVVGTWVIDSLHDYVLTNDGPLMAQHQATGLMAGLLVILMTNVLRQSPALSVYSVTLAAACYLLSAWHVDKFDRFLVVDTGLFAAMGGLLVFVSRRQRWVFDRIRERDALARFLPQRAMDRLTRDPNAFLLGGEEQEATVIFTDIRGFTALATTMTPTQVVAQLNEYFTEMVDEIFKWDGILDKFLGDGICAVFGPPDGNGLQAEKAVRCALGMLERLERINEARTRRGETALAIGIGIHSGRVVAGNIGSPKRMEYTHIGDAVNTASRIESLTKEVGQAVLISRATYERVRDLPVEFIDVAPMKVKGKAEPLELHAVRARPAS